MLNKAIQLYTSKSADYNAGDVTFDKYCIYGFKSVVQMLYGKVLRLVALESSGKDPRNESVEDTLVDLAVYAALGYAYLRKNREPDTSDSKPSEFLRRGYERPLGMVDS